MIDWMKLKPVRNLPVMLVLNCSGCYRGVEVRAKTTAMARNMALAGGWMIVSQHNFIAECPVHNPSRAEFFGYRTERNTVEQVVN